MEDSPELEFALSLDIIYRRPSASIVDRSNLQRVMEQAGRICYRSKLGANTYDINKFLRKIIKLEHTSVLGHGIIYATMTNHDYMLICRLQATTGYAITNFMEFAKDYSPNVSESYVVAFSHRTLVELSSLVTKGHLPEEMLSRLLPFADHPEMTEEMVMEMTRGALNMQFRTFHIRSDRAIGNEFVRSPAAFSQESTRYVSYKNGGVGMCVPYHLQEYFSDLTKPNNADSRDVLLELAEHSESAELNIFKKSCKTAYENYKEYCGVAEKQIARGALPLFLETNYIVTATVARWNNFLHYRVAPKAHQDIREQIARDIRTSEPIYSPMQLNRFSGEAVHEEILNGFFPISDES